MKTFTALVLMGLLCLTSFTQALTQEQHPPEEAGAHVEGDEKGVAECPYAKAKGFSDPFHALRDHFDSMEKMMSRVHSFFDKPSTANPLSALWREPSHPHHRPSLWNSLVPSIDLHADSLWPSVSKQEEALWHPVVDVSETDKHLAVHAELPGVKKEDIDISLKDNVLTLSGERKSSVDEADSDKKWHRVERSYGRFVRSMRLPPNVDLKNIKATHTEGVLQIEIPKLAGETGTEPQKIAIQ